MSLHSPIFVIDDDADDQFLLKAAFEELNIPNEVHFFANGRQALDFLLETTIMPFLILCDVNMPIMNGLELHEKITEHESLRKKAIPFVFLTTAADEKLVNEAYNQLVQGFYQKPTSFQGLKHHIEVIVSYWQHCLHPKQFPGFLGR